MVYTVLKRISPLIAAVLMVASSHAETLTDSAGRTIGIPDTVNQVLAAGRPASVLVYALKPEALLGWPSAFRNREAAYVSAEYRDLPVTGRLTGSDGDALLERVQGLSPDLIVDFGSVGDKYVELATRIQARAGIPYILADSSFSRMAESTRLVSRALGVAERGNALALDIEMTLSRLHSLPRHACPQVYFAEGVTGLEEGRRRGSYLELIGLAGGCHVEGMPRQVGSRLAFAMEPEIIITRDREFYDSVWRDPLWGDVPAVRDRQVYLSPADPFNWMGHLPSVNRVMGLKWLAGLFYPDAWEGDLRAEDRAFLQLLVPCRTDGRRDRSFARTCAPPVALTANHPWRIVPAGPSPVPPASGVRTRTILRINRPRLTVPGNSQPAVLFESVIRSEPRGRVAGGRRRRRTPSNSKYVSGLFRNPSSSSSQSGNPVMNSRRKSSANRLPWNGQPAVMCRKIPGMKAAQTKCR